MESAYFSLLLGDHEGTKAAIDSSEKILDQLDSVDLVVHASFYRVSGDYYKVSPRPFHHGPGWRWTLGPQAQRADADRLVHCAGQG